MCIMQSQPNSDIVCMGIIILYYENKYYPFNSILQRRKKYVQIFVAWALIVLIARLHANLKTTPDLIVFSPFLLMITQQFHVIWLLY